MANAVPPSQADVVASLAAAAEAARQAYLAALAANPGADLSDLYKQEMRAAALWSEAESKALNNDPRIAQAASDLDAATQAIRSNLQSLKDIAGWLNLLDSLVSTAAAVAKFFV